MSKYLEAAKAEIAKLDAREGMYKGDCWECKFCKVGDISNDIEFATCSNPVVQVVSFNQTDAVAKRRIQRCVEQRDTISLWGPVVCGPDGELFQPREPKKTFFERLFG